MRFVNPQSDFGFKKIFNENNTSILISFLNAVLEREGDNAIEELTFLPLEQEAELQGENRTVLDLKCRDLMGRYFMVEMQQAYFLCFPKRVGYYAARAFGGQIVKDQK